MIDPLDDDAYDRRKQRLVGILDRFGDLTIEDRRSSGSRALRLIVQAPGADLPRSAVFDYMEEFGRIAARWQLTKYRYEYREEPPPGRRAFHWHDDEFHEHCVDPTDLSRDHHYRGYAITIFEAQDEFAAIYASGARVSCAGLRAALTPS